MILQLYTLLTFKCITTLCSNVMRLWTTKRPPRNEIFRLLISKTKLYKPHIEVRKL